MELQKFKVHKVFYQTEREINQDTGKLEMVSETIIEHIELFGNILAVVNFDLTLDGEKSLVNYEIFKLHSITDREIPLSIFVRDYKDQFILLNEYCVERFPERKVIL